ncbi:unnamed protein product [Rotaria sp. Silwood1]|nr:unnamed protein product [Rotaria sp. Silwood1]
MENLNSILHDNALTWAQQKATLNLFYRLLQKHVPIPPSCIKTFADFLTYGSSELREYAAKGIAEFCHLQKPPRIYVEKPLKEIFESMDASLSVCINVDDFPGERPDNLWLTIDNYKAPKTQNVDPRRIHHLIHYFHQLINDRETGITSTETSRWYLIQCLEGLEWRIPSIWGEINEKGKELLDNSSSSIRKNLVS